MLSLMFSIVPLAALLVPTAAFPAPSVQHPKRALLKRQDELPNSCRFVISTETQEEIFGVNLAEDIPLALSKALISTHSGPLAIDNRTFYQISTNGDNTWSYTWRKLPFNPETSESLSPEEVTELTEKIVGSRQDTGNAVWTIESAGCDPLDNASTSLASDGETLIMSSASRAGHDSSQQLSKRQNEEEDHGPPCTFTLRPDIAEEIIGLELSLDMRSTVGWAVLGGLVETTLISFTPQYFALNSNGSWTFTRNGTVFGPDGVQWSHQQVIEASERTVGVRETADGVVFWTIEAASCERS